MEKFLFGLILLLIGLSLLITSILLIRKVFDNPTVTFNIGERVYMDSQLGRYTGYVKQVDSTTVTIESFSPGGRGNSMIATYDIKGIKWRKYENKVVNNKY